MALHRIIDDGPDAKLSFSYVSIDGTRVFWESEPCPKDVCPTKEQVWDCNKAIDEIISKLLEAKQELLAKALK